MVELNKIYNEDCVEGIKRLPDASIDCILTDPPYLYLKKQKLERPFDEQSLFAEFKRVLKPTGFVVLFGRGTSFYRWNTILADLGFTFKEEIVWDKGHCTSPVLRLSRVHETISLHTRGGVINKVKVPYLEMKQYDMDSIIQDIKRFCSVFTNAKSMEAVKLFLENNYSDASDNGKPIIRADMKNERASKFGVTRSKCKNGEVLCGVMQSMEFGMNEKSIIKCAREHYSAIHPTQKPVRLLERLLALTTRAGDVVLDPFSGSCSTAIACINTNRKFIGFEIDKEYYELGINRLKKVLSEPKLAL